MGTSKGYGGSGGKNWKELQGNIADWLDSLPTPDAEPTIDDPPNTDSIESDEQHENENIIDPAIANALRPLASALTWGVSNIGIGNGVVTEGGGGSSGRAPGRGRSRTRAARVGSRLASGVVALRSGDSAAMDALGLDLNVLQALKNVYQQAQMLAEAAAESIPNNLEDDELRKAATSTAIWALAMDGEGPQVEEIIRQFVKDYVYEVILTEIGSVLRSGDRDGVAAVEAEERIRSTISALADTVQIQVRQDDRADLAAVVDQVLESTRYIIGQPR